MARAFELGDVSCDKEQFGLQSYCSWVTNIWSKTDAIDQKPFKAQDMVSSPDGDIFDFSRAMPVARGGSFFKFDLIKSKIKWLHLTPNIKY